MTAGASCAQGPAPLYYALSPPFAMDLEGTFLCPYCLQINTILVDVSAGHHQDLIEDCEICCRSVRLTIDVDADVEEASISADIP